MTASAYRRRVLTVAIELHAEPPTSLYAWIRYRYDVEAERLLSG